MALSGKDPDKKAGGRQRKVGGGTALLRSAVGSARARIRMWVLRVTKRRTKKRGRRLHKDKRETSLRSGHDLQITF